MFIAVFSNILNIVILMKYGSFCVISFLYWAYIREDRPEP